MKYSTITALLSLGATTAYAQSNNQNRFNILVTTEAASAESFTRQGAFDTLVPINRDAVTLASQISGNACRAFSDAAGRKKLADFGSDTVTIGIDAAKATVGSVLCSANERQFNRVVKRLRLDGGDFKLEDDSVHIMPVGTTGTVRVQLSNQAVEAGVQDDIPADGKARAVSATRLAGVAEKNKSILATDASIVGSASGSCQFFADVAGKKKLGEPFTQSIDLSALNNGQPLNLDEASIACQ